MKIRLGILASLLLLALASGMVTAQDHQPTPSAGAAAPEHAEMGHMDSMSSGDAECDIEGFVLQQQTYAAALAAFPEAYREDPEAALRTVYSVGLTYQTFAISCGFTPPEAADQEHAGDHAASADEHSDEAHIELALSLGDPENGRLLFTTMQPETGFACATCHRVDSAETLIGPGLLNVADPSHDPSQHQHGGDIEMMMTGEALPERTMDEVITYIRSSILHPSEYVVPGFPDLLMPQIYGQIFSEQEIDDITAYLLTLPE